MKNNKQVKKDHYYEKYDNSKRFHSYFTQIKETLKLKPESVLEIGIGNKTVSDYLPKRVKKVKTLDFDKELNPDIVADVTNIPLEDNSFDVVLCCEVLEHISFNQFKTALKEISRVSKRYVILSLPHFSHPIYLNFKIPLFKEINFSVYISHYKKHTFDGQHYWEIGKKGYPLRRIKNALKGEFSILKDFREAENPYHHFFILEKRPPNLN